MAEILYELIDGGTPTGRVHLFEEGQQPDLPGKPNLDWLKHVRIVPGDEFNGALHLAEELAPVVDTQAGTVTYELKARQKTDQEIEADVDLEIGNVRAGEQEGVLIEVLIHLLEHVNSEAGLTINTDPAALYNLVTTATQKRADDIKAIKKVDPQRVIS
ncbi:MAG: hypothetical protein EX260_11505 [Desulfobulbaceae bacterium]|nr:MAG: hypothetical protein EX260_11505 [Desulfobulbaceae bacterium]